MRLLSYSGTGLFVASGKKISNSYYSISIWCVMCYLTRNSNICWSDFVTWQT